MISSILIGLFSNHIFEIRRPLEWLNVSIVLPHPSLSLQYSHSCVRVRGSRSEAVYGWNQRTLESVQCPSESPLPPSPSHSILFSFSYSLFNSFVVSLTVIREESFIEISNHRIFLSQQEESSNWPILDLRGEYHLKFCFPTVIP